MRGKPLRRWALIGCAALVGTVLVVGVAHTRMSGGVPQAAFTESHPRRVEKGTPPDEPGELNDDDPSIADPAGTVTPGTAPVDAAPSAGLLLPAPKPVPIPLPAGPLAPVFARLPTADRVIFLGIDDGYVRDPRVLDYLSQLRVPFTVFLTMGPAKADPGFWQRAQAAGGIIESHTLTHPNLVRMHGAKLQTEICGTLDPYEAMFGRRPTLFRPPFGNLDDEVRRDAASCGYRAIIEWKGSTNNGRLTMQEGVLHPGDALLLHWRPSLYDDLHDVVARCQQQHFTIGRLEDYLP